MAAAVYGLVAPLWDMCRSLADGLTGKANPYRGSVTSTKLKVAGLDVFSAGDFSGGGGGCEDIVLRDASREDLQERLNPRMTRSSVEELRELACGAVRSHLVADVPLGVFLSGGLDSSIVAAAACQEQSELITLSVDFDEPDYSEAPFIEQDDERRLEGEHVRVNAALPRPGRDARRRLRRHGPARARTG